LERKQPVVQDLYKVLLDECSRRFRQQVITEVDRPLLWLEDDIDVPYNFREIWNYYEQTLPDDWQVAVIGWGIIPDFEEIKIRCITPGWWHLESIEYASFGGSQAVLVNSGDWRLKLHDKEFRCDCNLCETLKDIGVTKVYHTDTILIGTNDPENTIGDSVIQYSKMTTPRYYQSRNGVQKRNKVRKIRASDFIGSIIPINTFTYLPDWLRNLWQ